MRLSTPEKLRQLQRKLYVKSKQETEFRFYSLYDKIRRRDVLEHAWRLVRSNRGALGIDGVNIEQAEVRIEKLLNELQEELKTERYRSQAVRRVYIPKPDGRQRPLGILIITGKNPQPLIHLMEDRLRQMGLTMNRQKTRIVNLRESPAHFLGFQIRQLPNNRREGSIWLLIRE